MVKKLVVKKSVARIVSAFSKSDARRKMKKLYPNHVIERIDEISPLRRRYTVYMHVKKR